MYKKGLCLIFLLLLCITSFSQEEGDYDYSDYNSYETEESANDVIFKPTLGLGIGTFTFLGDVNNSNEKHHPISGRICYELKISQKINSYLDANFYVLWGKLGANERTLTRNLNFESKITTGGMMVSYNFDHFLNPDRII